MGETIMVVRTMVKKTRTVVSHLEFIIQYLTWKVKDGRLMVFKFVCLYGMGWYVLRNFFV